MSSDVAPRRDVIRGGELAPPDFWKCQCIGEIGFLNSRKIRYFSVQGTKEN